MTKFRMSVKIALFAGLVGLAACTSRSNPISAGKGCPLQSGGSRLQCAGRLLRKLGCQWNQRSNDCRGRPGRRPQPGQRKPGDGGRRGREYCRGRFDRRRRLRQHRPVFPCHGGGGTSNVAEAGRGHRRRWIEKHRQRAFLQRGRRRGEQSQRDYSTVSGGSGNTANYQLSSVGGGTENQSSNEASVVAGGEHNLAQGSYSAITGGSIMLPAARGRWWVEAPGMWPAGPMPWSRRFFQPGGRGLQFCSRAQCQGKCQRSWQFPVCRFQ